MAKFQTSQGKFTWSAGSPTARVTYGNEIDDQDFLEIRSNMDYFSASCTNAHSNLETCFAEKVPVNTSYYSDDLNSQRGSFRGTVLSTKNQTRNNSDYNDRRSYKHYYEFVHNYDYKFNIFKEPVFLNIQPDPDCNPVGHNNFKGTVRTSVRTTVQDDKWQGCSAKNNTNFYSVRTDYEAYVRIRRHASRGAWNSSYYTFHKQTVQYSDYISYHPTHYDGQDPYASATTCSGHNGSYHDSVHNDFKSGVQTTVHSGYHQVFDDQ